MNYRKLGNTGILASEIGMGSEGLVVMAREDAIRLISAALEGGVNYFDLYNPQPEVRENLGRAVASRRSDVYIQGHLCTAWVDGQYVRTRDAKMTEKAFETMMHLARDRLRPAAAAQRACTPSWRELPQSCHCPKNCGDRPHSGCPVRSQSRV